MVKAALLVGINYYNTPYRLNGCIEDIVNMRNMLIDAYGYKAADIVILHDSTDPKVIKANGLPTGINILNYLYALALKSGGLEEVWFHYSGHGAQIRDTNGDEASGFDDVIVPSDFQGRGFLVDDDLYRFINLIKCRAVLLFDSCHSGTVCDLPWSFECKPASYLKTKNNKYTLKNQNVYMFSGCKDDQTSADTYDSTTKTYVGAFSRAFMEELRASGHSLPLVTLHRNVCINLAKNGYSQIPIFSSSNPNPIYVLSKTSSPSVNTTVVSKPSTPARKAIICMRF
jgi:hypothetical protein